MDTNKGEFVTTQIYTPRRGRPPLNRDTPPQDFSINATAPLRSVRVPPEISRLTLQDWDEWAEFFLSRFGFYWPGVYSVPTLKGAISTWSGSKDYLFIKNADAVLLAFTQIDPVSQRSVVFERFGWSRWAKKIGDRRMGIDRRGEGYLELLDLYRFARDWSRGLKAAFMLSGWSCDAAISDLTDTLNGEWVDWVISK